MAVKCKSCDKEFKSSRGENGLEGHYKAEPTHKPKSKKAKGKKKKTKRGKRIAAVVTGGNATIAAAVKAIDAEIAKLETAKAALLAIG